MEELLARSQEAIERGSKSFAAASRLFDQPTREGATLLYAWCRYCDDQIDDQTLGWKRAPTDREPVTERLATLERETRRALAGEPVAETAFRALQEVARRHAIPERYPLDLLRGFAMDVEERRYETLEDCCEYCYHVAGVVGVMMTYVMGTVGGGIDDDTLDRASDLGIALQMTNIARDVIDDAEVGRTYLPAAWLREAGVPVGEVGLLVHRPAVATVAARLLEEAERYYRSAQSGIARLPFRSAWAVAAARRVYRDIGRIVRERGRGAWDRRAGTGSGRKAELLLIAAGDAVSSRLASGDAPVSRDRLWTRPRG